MERNLRVPAGTSAGWSISWPSRDAVTYVAGNTMAMVLAFAIARFTLLQSHHISWVWIRTGDWMAYYAGGHLTALGHGSEIYNNAVVQRLQVAIFYPFLAPKGTVLPYIYHPYWALALAPLGALAYEASFDTFFIINVVAMATLLYAFERYSGVRGRAAFFLRFGAWISPPVFFCLVNGQASIFILFFVTVCFFALRNDHPVLAGTALALAAIKPPYLIPFVVVLLVRREWKATGACIAVSLFLLALPMAFMGPRIDLDFLHSALAMNVTGTPVYWFTNRNASIFALTDAWLVRPYSVLVAGTACLVILGGLAFYARRSRSIEASLALAAVAGVLINPHVLIHDMALMVLPAALLLRYLQPVSARAYLGVGVVYTAIVFGYFLSDKLPVRVLPFTVLALGSALMLATRRKETHIALLEPPADHATEHISPSADTVASLGVFQATGKRGTA